MQRDILNKIIKKAKTKNDGIYSLGGHKYKVKNKTAIFFSDNKAIFQLYGNFTVLVSEVDLISELVERLKKLD